MGRIVPTSARRASLSFAMPLAPRVHRRCSANPGVGVEAWPRTPLACQQVVAADKGRVFSREGLAWPLCHSSFICCIPVAPWETGIRQAGNDRIKGEETHHVVHRLPSGFLAGATSPPFQLTKDQTFRGCSMSWSVWGSVCVRSFGMLVCVWMFGLPFSRFLRLLHPPPLCARRGEHHWSREQRSPGASPS